MLKKLYIVLIVILVIVQNLTVECLNSKPVKRSVKDLRKNCKSVTHNGKCIGRDNGDLTTLPDKFNSKLTEYKPYRVRF